MISFFVFHRQMYMFFINMSAVFHCPQKCNYC